MKQEINKKYSIGVTKHGQFCLIEVKNEFEHLLKGCPVYTYEAAIKILEQFTLIA